MIRQLRARLDASEARVAELEAIVASYREKFRLSVLSASFGALDEPNGYSKRSISSPIFTGRVRRQHTLDQVLLTISPREKGMASLLMASTPQPQKSSNKTNGFNHQQFSEMSPLFKTSSSRVDEEHGASPRGRTVLAAQNRSKSTLSEDTSPALTPTKMSPRLSSVMTPTQASQSTALVPAKNAISNMIVDDSDSVAASAIKLRHSRLETSLRDVHTNVCQKINDSLRRFEKMEREHRSRLSELRAENAADHDDNERHRQEMSRMKQAELLLVSNVANSTELLVGIEAAMERVLQHCQIVTERCAEHQQQKETLLQEKYDQTKVSPKKSTSSKKKKKHHDDGRYRKAHRADNPCGTINGTQWCDGF